VEFIAVNTDLQALGPTASVKIRSGQAHQAGRGQPAIGRRAAVDTEDLRRPCCSTVFITAGLAAAPAPGRCRWSPRSPANSADRGVLTVAVVTLPFSLEGKRRMSQAMDGLGQLKDCVDSVIAIPNDRLLNSVARNTPVSEAFRVADDVLKQAVQGISDIITVPGQINLDFADVRAVMKGMGQAVMGTGVGQGENRAVEAAQRAISNPCSRTPDRGAKGVT
jgi:cell division protein FtsZ